jgi:hypothetical protein
MQKGSQSRRVEPWPESAREGRAPSAIVELRVGRGSIARSLLLVRLLLFCGGGNSIGRPYCLWLLAQELGWVCTPVLSGPMWPPLKGTRFADQAVTLEEVTGRYDAAIAHQLAPATIGRSFRHMGHRPTLIDVDEAVWENLYGFSRASQARVAAGLLRRGRNPVTPHRHRRQVMNRVTILSNPTLQTLYPGTVIPHVRKAYPVAPWPEGPFSIAFVGTARSHKGIERLRQAADATGTTLTLTADPPADPRPFERWVGSTTFPEGQRLVEASDAVAIVSDDTPFSRSQLPVKLIDAMLAGRAVIASDLPPIRWALDDAGLLIPPGDGNALTEMISLLRSDPDQAKELGRAARARALDMFTPEVVAPVFKRTVLDAV